MKPLLLLQSEYLHTPAVLVSARNLITAKCRNMIGLLNRYWYYRQQRFPDQARLLRQLTSNIHGELNHLTETQTLSVLLLTEARASKYYWQGFALIGHCPNGWTRIHPHASDSVNQALNIGYTFLANALRPIVSDMGFSPEIGILHSPRRGREALLYDWEELFRQPIVDACLLSLFARSRPENIELDTITKKLAIAFQKPILYRNRLVRFATFAQNQLQLFHRALVSQQPFVPYRYPWSHLNKKRRFHG